MGWPINEVILRVPLLYDAVSNAYANNVVTVVAMGNEFEKGNPTNYPAAFAHEVIAVGNTDRSLNRWPTSSTGPHINVSAPGTSIWTTDRGGQYRQSYRYFYVCPCCFGCCRPDYFPRSGP